LILIKRKHKLTSNHYLYRLNSLLLSTKGAVFCIKERSDFALCRATPAGKLGDPELCESKAASFL
jgi:hypothetical protein